MGRTLHFKLTKSNGNFTRKELEAVYNISLKYNSKNYGKLWTCENFYISPYEFFPNWYGKYQKVDSDKAWKEVQKNIEALQKQGKHRFDAILELVKREDVCLMNGLPKAELRGFTKTQGNELNSLLVLLALTEISQQLPATEIHLSDEGEFLLCDLKIRKGKAMPQISSLTNDIQRYCHLMLFSERYESNILGKLNYKPEDFTHEFQMDCSINNSYGDMTKYINKKLRNLKEVENALMKQGLAGKDLYLFNLEQRESKDWFCPLAFTRKVDIEKYVDYKRSPATLMDGFDGEGFGLTTEDAELKSYKSIAKLQKLFDNPKLELKVLGESAE